MNCRALALALSILFIPARAADIPDGQVIDRVPCDLPPATADPDYAGTIADSRFVCEKLRYASDGLPVVAFLYRPRETPASKLPVIVFNRGSYIVNNQAPVLLPTFRRLALDGFMILAPMYRGSEGAPGRDEVGGADLHDLMNITKLVARLDGADAANLFLYGESRGAVMCFMALRDGFPARAAATTGGFTDFAAYLAVDKGAAAIVKQVWPDWDQRRDDIIATRSAQRFAEKLNAPVLLMHGGADPQVNPEHSLKLALRLQQLGKPFSIIVFAGDRHQLRESRVERDRQTAAWFRRHTTQFQPTASTRN